MDQRRIGGTGAMLPNASGGTRSIRKSRFRPLGMSMKAWKAKLRRGIGRHGTRTLRRPVTFGRTSNIITGEMMQNIANNFNPKLRTDSTKSAYKTLKKVSSKFRKSLKSVKKQEKRKLSAIAEEHKISRDELENHIDTITDNKLTEISNTPIPAGANAATVEFINRLRHKAIVGLEFGAEAYNPDNVENYNNNIKMFRKALKDAFILQKTYEGQNSGYGKEQGTIAYHEFMQQALIDIIHRERPDIEVDKLAAMLGSIL